MSAVGLCACAGFRYHSYSLHGGCSTPLLAPAYPLASCNASAAYHRAALLSPESTVAHAGKYAEFAADAALASVPLVIGEGNTESGGEEGAHIDMSCTHTHSARVLTSA